MGCTQVCTVRAKQHNGWCICSSETVFPIYRKFMAKQQLEGSNEQSQQEMV